MAESISPHLLCELSDGVMTLRLNRADKRNALTRSMYSDLAEALNTAAADEAVKVVVITGTGNTFCVGSDIGSFQSVTQTGEKSPVVRFMRSLAAFPKPIVAAVNGTTMGIGVTLLLHCDLVYAVEKARFQLPFVNLGIAPEFASTYLLPRIIGHFRAMELLMFGEPFVAEKAKEYGLVNEVLAVDQLGARVSERARQLASQPPGAISTCKRLVKSWTEASITKAIPLEAEEVWRMLEQGEAKEAIAALLEKRKPDFKRKTNQ